MVKVCEDLIETVTSKGKVKKGFYMDGFLKENLDYELKRIGKNWDAILLYDGEEGSAKTTLACANAFYLSHEKGLQFGIDSIVFSQKDFMSIVDKAEPFTNIVWDEFVLSGLNLEALNTMQITLIKKMTIIRKKRLVIHLIIPYMFMLSKYFAIRTRCLIHVYSPDNLTRGFFSYFSKPKKKKLYIDGKKYWEYNVKGDFNGGFTNTFGLFFDENEYNKKKDIATENLSDNYHNLRSGKTVYLAIMYLKLVAKFKHREIAQLMGWNTHSGVDFYLKKYSKECDLPSCTKEKRLFGLLVGLDKNLSSKQPSDDVGPPKGDEFLEKNEEQDAESEDGFKKEYNKQNVFDIS